MTNDESVATKMLPPPFSTKALAYGKKSERAMTKAIEYEVTLLDSV
jgi:hypothetical protein